MVTGEDPYPVEIKNEDISFRYDFETYQEKADTIIVQQVLKCASETNRISVVSDDTDVFVLLVHHYEEAKLRLPMRMESPSKERAVIDIQLTVEKHRDIVGQLLPAHALSGCDTVACYFGVGKGSVVKTLRAGYKLDTIGDVGAPLHDILEEATAFMSACYGMKDAKDMSETRLYAWGKNNGKGHKRRIMLGTESAFPSTHKGSIHRKCEKSPLPSNVVAEA